VNVYVTVHVVPAWRLIPVALQGNVNGPNPNEYRTLQFSNLFGVTAGAGVGTGVGGGGAAPTVTVAVAGGTPGYDAVNVTVEATDVDPLYE
jgi:hypothetical protein